MILRSYLSALLVGIAGCLVATTAPAQSQSFAFGYEFQDVQLTGTVSQNANATSEVHRGLVTVGSGMTDPKSNLEALMLHIDVNGEPISATRYLRTGDDLTAASVVIAHDERHVVIAGEIGQGAASLPGAWVAKIATETQQIVWSRRLISEDETAHERASFVVRLPRDQLGGEDYLVGGQVVFPSALPPSAVQYLARISDEGTLRWARRYDRKTGAAIDRPTMALAQNGRIAVTGVRSNQFPYIMVVDPINGEPDPGVYYYEHSWLHAADSRPHLARIDGNGYVLAYTVRPQNAPTSTSIAGVYLDDNFDVNSAWMYVAPFDPGELRGFGAYYNAGGIQLNTMIDGQAGFLRLDPTGDPVSHHLFRFPSSSPPNALPMAVVTNGYALAQADFSNNAVWLGRTDWFGVNRCTQPPTNANRDDLDISRKVAGYASEAWGEIDKYDVETVPTRVVPRRCP